MASTVRYPISEFLNGKGSMVFNDFVVQARAAGLRPEGWLKEKQAGKVVTELQPDGTLVIRAIVSA